MKKILVSVSIIAAIAAIVSGATYAYFTAQDTITGNTISTATVKIKASGEANSVTLPKPIQGTNLVPGQWTAWYRGAIFNQSSVPLKLYMYVDNLTGSACDKTVLQMTTGHAGGNEQERTIYNNWLQNIAGVANKIEITGNPPFATVPAGWSQVVQQKAQLHDTADNAYVGTDCTWDEVFVGETVAP